MCMPMKYRSIWRDKNTVSVSVSACQLAWSSPNHLDCGCLPQVIFVNLEATYWELPWAKQLRKPWANLYLLWANLSFLTTTVITFACNEVNGEWILTTQIYIHCFYIPDLLRLANGHSIDNSFDNIDVSNKSNCERPFHNLVKPQSQQQTCYASIGEFIITLKYCCPQISKEMQVKELLIQLKYNGSSLWCSAFQIQIIVQCHQWD